jgi:hypothetical protein
MMLGTEDRRAATTTDTPDRRLDGHRCDLETRPAEVYGARFGAGAVARWTPHLVDAAGLTPW